MKKNEMVKRLQVDLTQSVKNYYEKLMKDVNDSRSASSSFGGEAVSKKLVDL